MTSRPTTQVCSLYLRVCNEIEDEQCLAVVCAPAEEEEEDCEEEEGSRSDDDDGVEMNPALMAMLAGDD